MTDYLLKPFEFERFLVAVNKVKSASQAKQKTIAAAEKEAKDHLFVTVQKKKVKLLFADIVYIESQKEYVRIVTSQKDYLARIGTAEIESLLPQQLFKRVHRSFIISLAKIDSYTSEEVEVNGTTIPIGRDYRDVTEHF